MKFQNALIRYVENEDYVDPMITMGELVHGRVDQFVPGYNTHNL